MGITTENRNDKQIVFREALQRWDGFLDLLNNLLLNISAQWTLNPEHEVDEQMILLLNEIESGLATTHKILMKQISAGPLRTLIEEEFVIVDKVAKKLKLKDYNFGYLSKELSGILKHRKTLEKIHLKS